MNKDELDYWIDQLDIALDSNDNEVYHQICDDLQTRLILLRIGDEDNERP